MTRGSLCLIVGLIIVVAAPLGAQTTTPRLQFDVASVKPNTSGDPGLRLDVQPGGRFVASNIPLKQFIRAAYTLQLYQIVNAPAWVDAERFDITAVADRDITVTTGWTPGSFAPVQLMMQSLLADRFRMTAHNETRQSLVYSLVTDKANRDAATKLRAAAPDCASNCGMRVAAGSLTARKVPLRQVAELLSQLTGRLVTDDTGLAGDFDLDLQWNPDSQVATDSPSIFTAVQEQLGLRLESRRSPLTVLVIDSIARPTPD